MTPTGTVLLVGGLVVMVGLVIVLSRTNRRNLGREGSRQATDLGFTSSPESDRLRFLDWLWRRTDSRRRAWGPLEGRAGR